MKFYVAIKKNEVALLVLTIEKRSPRHILLLTFYKYRTALHSMFPFVYSQGYVYVYVNRRINAHLYHGFICLLYADRKFLKNT